MWRRFNLFVLFLFVVLQTVAQKSKDSLEFASFYYDALRYMAIDNKDMAMQHLERCSKLIDDNASTYFLRGQLFVEQGDLESATKLLEKAYKIDSSNFWYLRALAGLYIQKGQNEKAYDLYSDQLKDTPDNDELHLALAKLFEGNNEFAKALEHYDKYCELTGYPSQELMKCVKLNYELQHFEMALTKLDQLLERDANDFNLWILKAELLLKLDKKEEVKVYFDSMTARFPDIPEVRFTYAEYLYIVQDFSKLRKQLTVVLGDPVLGITKKIELLRKVINTQIVLFSDEQINEWLGVLVEVHSDSYDVNFIAGSFSYESKKFDKAAKLFANARRIQPNHMKVWLMEMNSLAITGSFPRMNEVVDSALLLYPSYPDVYFFKALASYRMKDHSLAIENIETGIDFILDSAAIWIDFKNLEAEIYYDKKDYVRSFSIYEEILTKNPENEMVANNYAYFLAQQNQKLGRAESLIVGLLKRNPADHKFLDTYAWVLYKGKKYNKALEQIELALKSGGESSSVLNEHHGDILSALERFEDAQKAYEAALKLDSSKQSLKDKLEKISSQIQHK